MATVIRRPRPGSTMPPTRNDGVQIQAGKGSVDVHGNSYSPALNAGVIIDRNVTVLPDDEALIEAARAMLLDIKGVSEITKLPVRTISIYLSNARKNKAGVTKMPINELEFGSSPVWHRNTIVAWQATRPKVDKLDKS